VYDLMMQRTIERLGAWRGPRENALEELIRGVTCEHPGKADTVRDALTTSVERGDLVLQETAEGWRWRWLEELPDKRGQGVEGSRGRGEKRSRYTDT
jgi:hypothetical protein